MIVFVGGGELKKVFLGNTEIKKIYVGDNLVYPSWKGIYQQVEYIQSSGTQRIQTGVTPNQNTKSQIKFMNLEYTGNVIFGYTYVNDENDYRFFNANQKLYRDNIALRINTEYNTIIPNTIYELELGNFYVKDLATGSNIVTGTAQSSFTGSNTITLNHMQAWSTSTTSYTESNSKNRWYYVKIYNGNTLIRDMVPVYRKSDGVIGMYDKVNSVFYTNSGSGSFTKGPDVN